MCSIYLVTTAEPLPRMGNTNNMNFSKPHLAFLLPTTIHHNTAQMAADDKLSLRDLLESLPQEIYDEIYSLTFTPDIQCTFIGRLRDMVKWLQHIEHCPPANSGNIRCYLWEDPDRWAPYVTYSDKTISMTLEVEEVEADFGRGCCLCLPMYWTRQEVCDA
ncbi:hypothetical protein AC579_8964 [Pseudocercospora musae]|uniref:Uncharacterized protein n=1 Tax=Pseudocercospora musae TaxID=113226 RepID=A0A139I5X7_9PEZI|nr:hypothetical protein AC579_8964 [Pseudocercospora musae]